MSYYPVLANAKDTAELRKALIDMQNSLQTQAITSTRLTISSFSQNMALVTGSGGVVVTVPYTGLVSSLRKSLGLEINNTPIFSSLVLSSNDSSSGLYTRTCLVVTNSNPALGNGSSTYNRSSVYSQAGNAVVVSLLGAKYESGGVYGYVGSVTNNDFQFITNATDRGRIDNLGSWLIGSGLTSNGLRMQLAGNFSINDYTTVNSNAFWEQGACTLTLGDSSGNSATMGSNNYAWYTRVGKQVTICGTIDWTSTTALATGSRIRITWTEPPALKNPAGTYRSVASLGSSYAGSFVAGVNRVTFQADKGNKYLVGSDVTTQNNDVSLVKAQIASLGTIYGFSFTYQID